MSIILIRHAATPGNLRHAYTGCRTDEHLCADAAADIAGRHYPAAERVFASPLARCLETAALIYPGMAPCEVPGFRECDFGDFEGLSYSELNGRSDYQAWIDSGGKLPFPHGESRSEFAARSVKAFEAQGIWKSGEDTALIVHGGTIMAIMEAYAKPSGSYFDFQVKNAEGYILERDGSFKKTDFR